MQIRSMSDKEIAIALVKRLPENATLVEIAKKIGFVSGVREGFTQLDRGMGIPLGQVRLQLHSFLARF
jgi:hypothetical protein